MKLIFLLFSLNLKHNGVRDIQFLSISNNGIIQTKLFSKKIEPL